MWSVLLNTTLSGRCPFLVGLFTHLLLGKCPKWLIERPTMFLGSLLDSLEYFLVKTRTFQYCISNGAGANAIYGLWMPITWLSNGERAVYKQGGA